MGETARAGLLGLRFLRFAVGVATSPQKGAIEGLKKWTSGRFWTFSRNENGLFEGPRSWALGLPQRAKSEMELRVWMDFLLGHPLSGSEMRGCQV